MLEIEQRYARVDEADLRARLSRAGARPCEERTEADHYFNAPDRDFVQTGEAVRLRRVGPGNVLTYKGPRRTGPVKVRPEIEVPLADGDEAAERCLALLQQLGDRPVVVVRKRRALFALPRGPFEMTVCFDDVERVGRFVEVEVLAPEERAEEAAAAIAAAAADLGLTEVESRSYLAMTLAALEGRP